MKNCLRILFEDLGAKIPESISKHFIYPKYLYNIQAEVLKQYHKVQPEVLYRSDDVWDIAKENTSKVATLVGTEINPYYTVVKTTDQSESYMALVLPFTINGKQNINAYLVGKCDKNGNQSLKVYKYNKDAAILGTLQLDTLIEQDENLEDNLYIIFDDVINHNEESRKIIDNEYESIIKGKFMLTPSKTITICI